MSSTWPSPTGHVRLYGDARDTRGYELRDFLQRSVVEFQWLDVSADPRVASRIGLAGLAGLAADRLPVCDFPDCTRLYRPTVAEVAALLGWITQPRSSEYDLSIYGAGPAGLSAAVYAASEGLRTVLIERHAVGGQAGTSSRIENFLGFPGGISGADLAERARQQAVDFGAELLFIREGIHAVFADGRIHVELADGGKLVARSNICATGVEYRRLSVPDEHRFLGRGVYYGAATSEAPLCRDEHVIVVGGGNSAGQAAMHLSKYARRVIVLIRGRHPAASMSEYLLSRLRRTSNIEIRPEHEIVALVGDSLLSSVHVRDRASDHRYELPSGRVFVLIDGAPNTDWAKDTTIIRDPAGYLITGPDLLQAGRPPAVWPLDRQPHYLETSVPGSFAAGDVRQLLDQARRQRRRRGRHGRSVRPSPSRQ
jgi:thioredoxin reductase (NADPH)